AGDPEADLGEWRKTKLARALAASAQKLVEEWDQKIAKDFAGLLEIPGARLVAAESAVEKLRQWCQTCAEAQNERLHQEAAKTAAAWNQLQEALRECLAGPT